ncbi:MAG: 2,3-diketo-5-methylthiopentyl-1-phosphate enolase [Alicyclobacillus mali]|uniref:2,3-diketo-5-methylthiopentyl-1-phosphate enolase n=1 Tax=Alicyclobacillus mali (ex Roth et al. 2021) TaxID=1123961 RepID=UPI0023F2F8F4|nr:2,3-diketo-5-methylthiopentyl-1-phosphate enolase [Alicyclobacillus mali (ex Roth et al. 2021)]MCL6488754.1 2,3-diketo-5-methylthiopentyl-1-phosphate enolase [Alicyclobacillus mali (ex Roth et al. 2021)]
MVNHDSSPRDAVVATYRLRDRKDKLEARAEGIAVGLTIGTWTDLPAARKSEVAKHCGRVEGIRVLEERPEGDVVAEIDIAYPVANLNGTFASLLVTVFGKLSMDGEIRLERLQMPDSLVRQFPGPKFGVEGVRQRLGAYHRPLVMSIFKACAGLTLDELVEAFGEQAEGGVDLVKDDEIFFTEAYATPEDRVRAYAAKTDEIAQRTGRRTAYAVNLTGPVHSLRERARRLAELGAGALLVNVVAYGYDVVADLARDPEVHVPILAHPAVSGALYGSPNYGIAADIVLGQLMRLAGADIGIFPSMYGSVTLGREATDRLLQHLRAEGPHKPVLPAPSAGIYPGLVPRLYQDFGVDLVLNAGGGIHGHPGGARMGGRAFFDAIWAVEQGVPLQEAAKDRPALLQALEKRGMPS